MSAAAPPAAYICLSFSFSLCSIFSSPLPFFLRKTADRGCTLSEWERATAVLGTALGRPYSLSPHFCNEEFCYKFPKLLNRFRPPDLADDPPHVQCTEVMLKRGQYLCSLGSPDGEQSVFLPYKPRRPYVNNTDSLRLCLSLSLLPPYPFNHTFIKAALKERRQAEADDETVLKTTREQSHMQGMDPMSRQFAEVLINIGVEQVNSKKYKEAIRTFNLIIGKAGLSAGVLIGRGTALALQGRLDEAIADYTRAIELDPKLLDGWRRRAQARTAFNQLRQAAEDYTKALEVVKGQDAQTLELLMERVMVYQRLRDNYRAAKDLRAILKLKPNEPELLLSLGQALLQLGEAGQAVEVFTQAVQLLSYNKVLWAHLGMAYRDATNYAKATEAFRQATRLDPSYPLGYKLAASLDFKLGDYRGALKNADKCLAVDSNNVEARYIKASSHHLLGDFSSAVQNYDVLLTLGSMPEEQRIIFQGFYQREVAAYTASIMSSPFSKFDISSTFPSNFKEYWATRHVPTDLMPGYTMQPSHLALRYTGTFPYERGLAKEIVDGRKKLVDSADAIGAWAFSLSSRTLVRNPRQMRAAGMAAIEMMQALVRLHTSRAPTGTFFRATQKQSEDGDDDDDDDSDVAASSSSSSTSSWRSFFNIFPRWAILGNPTEAVVWVDELTKPEFREGFGVTSMIVSGHAKSPENYPQLTRALWAAKEEILDTGQVLVRMDKRGQGTELLDLDPTLGPQIEYAESCRELWDAVGQDFQVLTPCYSTARPKHILNGTALSIARLQDEGGYSFSLRTLLTPERWRDYDQEMKAAWKHLKSLFAEGAPAQSKALSAALRLVYHWYNFAPLAHSSPLAGHVALASVLMAAGFDVSQEAKDGTQLDWEATLTPTFLDFKSQVTPWLHASLKALSPNHADLLSLPKAYPTVSTVVQMLDTYGRS